MRALAVWNMILSILVVGLLVQLHGSTEIQVLRNDNQTNRILIASLQRDVKTLEDTLSTMEMDTHSMVTQCELTLDLLVAAGRGGWWTKRVLGTLAHIQKVKQERKGS